MSEEPKPIKFASSGDDYFIRFMKQIKKMDISKKTMYAYDQSISRCIEFLNKAKMTTNPTKIGEKEIVYLRDTAMSELTTKTKIYYFSFFNSYLEYYNNRIVTNMHFHWPSDKRVKADWLTPENAKALLNAPLTLGQQLVVSLELCMGLRRVEVIRLTVDKIYSDRIDVRGKGRAGGKWRTVPLSSNTKIILTRYLEYRDRQISEFLRTHPNAEVPNEVFLHTKQGTIQPYSEHGVGFDYKFVLPVREKTGIKYGNHTLRRTFGRQLWKSNVPIETISRILGHESISVTMLYIGVNNDDMSEAIRDLTFD